ncbi:MAG: D-alanyl-D-alanine carboxypeptidase [Clostridiales bacterium]|nr:D-alanyl-D-alanine carboxypeptidase [Clostridiales bacterium]
MLKKSACALFSLLLIWNISPVSSGLDLSAAGAVVYCVETGGILYEKNAYSQMSMASTTKIMTSLIALEENTPFRRVTITAEMVNVEGSSSGLEEGDIVTLKDLVYCMLLESGNEAANAAAYAISGSLEGFAELMNERAAEIGMTGTSFETPSGLDGENHYTTAYDMALLTAAALENEDFCEICASVSYKLTFINSDKTVTLYNHNKLLQSYDDCIGVKTGYTKKSGRCLVSAAKRDGVTVIAVTLNDGNDWEDHVKMLDYGFSLCKSEKIKTDFSAYSVPVVNSDVSFVGVEGVEAAVALASGEDKSEIQVKIYLEKFLYAPVNKGDAVGYAEYIVNGRTAARITLTASDCCEITK